MSFACYKTAPGTVPTHDYVSVPFDKTPRQAVREHGGPEAVFEHLYANEEDAKARTLGEPHVWISGLRD